MTALRAGIWSGEVWLDEETGRWFVCSIIGSALNGDASAEEFGPFPREAAANAVLVEVAEIVRKSVEMIDAMRRGTYAKPNRETANV